MSEKMSKNMEIMYTKQKGDCTQARITSTQVLAHFSQNDSCNINVEINNHLFSFFFFLMFIDYIKNKR